MRSCNVYRLRQAEYVRIDLTRLARGTPAWTAENMRQALK
jgi:hypothetical protein